MSEIGRYDDRYPEMLDQYTFAITLCAQASDSAQWDISAAAVPKTVPDSSFVISSGIQFHDAQIQKLDARIDFSGEEFSVNDQRVRIVTSPMN
ncbi:MAG: hypothetical protein AAF385_17320 [Pseudomonadota bacterium]